jgi:hypothetical protein
MFDVWKTYAPEHYQLTTADVFDTSWLMYSSVGGGDVDRPFSELMVMLGFPAGNVSALDEVVRGAFSSGKIGLIPIPAAGTVYFAKELGNDLIVYASDGVFKVTETKAGPVVTRLLYTGADGRGAVAGDDKVHLMLASNGVLWKISAQGTERLGYGSVLGTLGTPLLTVYEEDHQAWFFSDGTKSYMYRDGELCEMSRSLTSIWQGYAPCQGGLYTLGAGLITSPGFATSAPWVLGTAYTHSATELNMHYANTGAGETLTLLQAPATDTEKLYLSTLLVATDLTGTASFYANTGASTGIGTFLSGCRAQPLPMYVAGQFGVSGVGVGTGIVYRISLKEITNWLTVSNFGAECLNPLAAKWTLDAGWAYSALTRVFTGTAVTGSATQVSADQVSALARGEHYLVSIVAVVTAGTVTVNFGGSLPIARVINASGTYNFLHPVQPTGAAIRDFLLTGVAFTGTVTVSIKKYTGTKTSADSTGDTTDLGDVLFVTEVTKLDSAELKRISFVEAIYSGISNARMRVSYRYSTSAAWLTTEWVPDNGLGTFYIGISALEFKFHFRGTPLVLAGTNQPPSRVEQLTAKVMYGDSRSARGPRGTGLQAE